MAHSRDNTRDRIEFCFSSTKNDLVTVYVVMNNGGIFKHGPKEYDKSVSLEEDIGTGEFTIKYSKHGTIQTNISCNKASMLMLSENEFVGFSPFALASSGTYFLIQLTKKEP